MHGSPTILNVVVVLDYRVDYSISRLSVGQQPSGRWDPMADGKEGTVE
jgi:hypothetical protein